MIHDIHHATFKYNYVNRAVWGEKWCTTPLQDLDELHGKQRYSMEYRTSKPDDNNLGNIANMAWELSFMLQFIRKYDPLWLLEQRWAYCEENVSSEGVRSRRSINYRYDSNVSGVSLNTGMVINNMRDPSRWGYETHFSNYRDFLEFVDIVTDVRSRFNRLLNEQASDSLGKIISDCRAIFIVRNGELLSTQRIRMLTEYRELIVDLIDQYLGTTDIKMSTTEYDVRNICLGDDAAPIRALFREVSIAVKNKEAAIL